MIENHNLTSLLIPSQLPEHIRDDPAYANFVLFLQAYYEWMEQNGNVTERTKNLTSYIDIDSSTSEFLNYFYNDFLSYFPEELLVDKTEVVKLAKELYKSKGTPASYQLLFRILYNMDVDFFYTKDAVLKSSNGKWYVSKSLKLSTDLIYVDTISYSSNTITIKTVISNDLTPNTSFTLSGTTATTNPPDGTWKVSNIVDDKTFSFNATNIPTGTLEAIDASVYIPSGFANKYFLDTNNLRIFGETTKSIATIENSVVSGKRIEVFISNIERLFESGEYVRIVDTNNQDVLFNGYPLRAKILGQISQININPTNRGLLYQPQDPVIVYGGLNTPTGIGATAEVKETTTGSIQRIKVEYGSYGYTKFINSGLQGSANTRLNITNAIGAQAHVTVLDSIDNPNKVDVSFIPIDYIGLCNNVTIGNTTLSFFANNITANANTSLANSFTFTSFSTYPISSVIVDNGGGGISQTPVVTADSLYYTKNLASLANLKNLGILAPIQIIDPGLGYVANDKIIFTGGTGYKAYANVTSVNSSGSILTTSFVHDANNKLVSLGGMGYTVGALIPSPNVANTQILNTLHNTEYKLGSGLPSLSVNSANVAAANAVLVIPGILGDGALFTPQVDRVGSITTINVSNYGEDYVSAPQVSIKVQDIIVKGLTLDNLPYNGDVVYQGTLNTGYVALVDSITMLIPNAVSTASVYRLRVYNYNAKPAFTTPLNVVDKTISMIMTTEYNAILPIDDRRDVYGVLTYGDGTAKATAKFLNGLTIGEGEYLNSTGHPSSFDVIQSTEFNNYTYKITLEKEIDKYRKTLLDLLHPTGMKVIGRYALKSEAQTDFNMVDKLNTANTLLHYTGSSSSNVTMSVPIATNLFTYSQDFSNAAWIKLNSTVTPAANIAPDGTQTATTLILNSGISYSVSDGSGANYQLPGIAQTYTWSVYAKAGALQSIAFRNNWTGAIAIFNLSTGVVTAQGSGTSTITSIGNGWYRCVNTYTVVSGSNGISLRPYAASGTSDGYSGIFIWGAQLEAGSVATSYTRTISAPASSPGAQSNNIVQVNSLGSFNLRYIVNGRNLFTGSNIFTATYWVLQSMTCTSSTEIAPDGTATASLFTVTTGYTPLWRNTIGQTAGTIFTMSGYFKSGTGTTVNLTLGNNGLTNYTYALFNLTTGTRTSTSIGGTGTYINSAITSLGNGWYRCSVTGIVDSSSTIIRTDYVFPNSSTIYACNMQLEVGSVATNYLNTYNLSDTTVDNNIITMVTTQGNGIYSEILSANTSANTITLKDNVWLTFANVAYVTANASSNTIKISSLTGQYDIINNGNYSNPAYPLVDIVEVGDNVIVANNMYKTVSAVDYSNNIIYLSANLTNNVNSSMSVNRTLTASAAYVKISKPVS